MPRRLPPLSALRAFEAAARHGSFKRASAELAVTPTAVSHQIRSLEIHTGLSLFERRTRQVALTEAGAQLYPVLRDGFDAFAEAVDRLTKRHNRSQVTISATTAFTARWLLPRVATFRSQHPDIDLQLHASDEVVDLSRTGIDIAIRYGDGPYPGLAAEELFADSFAPVANPLLKIQSATDLAAVTLIEFPWLRPHPGNPTWERWFAAAGMPMQVPPQLRFSDESHAIQATVAGQGVALASLTLVIDDISTGRLVQPFGPTLPGHCYHLLVPEGSISSAAAAAVEWLRQEALHVAWPTGITLP